MRHALPTLALALLVLAHLDWARLAFAGGLAAGGALLLVEAGTFAALAVALRRASRPLAVGALLAAAAVEALGILALGVGGFGLLANLGIVAGILLCAWGARRSATLGALRHGAPVVAAGLAAYAARDALAGQWFLMPGLLLALAGWTLLAWRALTAAAPTAADDRTGNAPPAGG